MQFPQARVRGAAWELMVAAAVLWAVAAALAAVLLWTERGATLERAAKLSSAMTLVMEEHTARTFQAVDLAVSGVADVLDLRTFAQNDPALQKALAARIAELPYIRAIYVIGPDGYIVHDTDYPKTPNVSLADRDYFRRYVTETSLERAISAPLQSRSDQGWFIAVTHRIGTGDRFKGVVVAAIQPRHFDALYQKMGLAGGEAIQLYHSDGQLIAGYPRDARLAGAVDSRNPDFGRIPPGRSGVRFIDASTPPAHRMVTYRAVEREPLVVSLEQNMDDVLRGWRKSVTATVAALLLLLAAMLALALLLIRQRMLRERASARAAQTEKLEALGQLTGGISHDFNNLLNVINTNLALVARHAARDARLAKPIGVAQRAVMRGAHLVRQLLAFARDQPIDLKPIDLGAVALESEGLLREAVGAGVELTFERDADLARCLADETQVEMALVNLCVNARDAMQGSGRIVIRTQNCTDADAAGAGLARGARYVRLSVTDTGTGMAEAIRRRAFEPFFSTKGEGGTGLGLAQVYGFIRQIGGDVGVDTQPGRGATVHLYFRCTNP